MSQYLNSNEPINPELKSNTAIMAGAILPGVASAAAFELYGNHVIKKNFGTKENAKEQSRFWYGALHETSEQTRADLMKAATSAGLNPSSVGDAAAKITNGTLGHNILTDKSATGLDKVLNHKAFDFFNNGASTKMGRINAYGLGTLTGAIPGLMTIARKGETETAIDGTIGGGLAGLVGAEAGMQYGKYKHSTPETLDSSLSKLEGKGIRGSIGSWNSVNHEALSEKSPTYEGSKTAKLTSTKARRWGVRGAGSVLGGLIGYGLDAATENVIGAK